MSSNLPVLYSFRRCPFAIRARVAIFASDVSVALREVDLKNKPKDMLEASAKAEVPVLVLSSGEVLDESLDIMRWALEQHDKENLLKPENGDFAEHPLLRMTDDEFKPSLDRYKYADRNPELSELEHRQQCEVFVQKLENGLAGREYFLGDDPTAVDIAIFPFVRQMASVDRAWFDSSRYSSLRLWLDKMLKHHWFVSVMQKFPPWQPGDLPTVFPTRE